MRTGAPSRKNIRFTKASSELRVSRSIGSLTDRMSYFKRQVLILLLRLFFIHAVYFSGSKDDYHSRLNSLVQPRLRRGITITLGGNIDAQFAFRW